MAPTKTLLGLALGASLLPGARACELCAIYGADAARPDAARGWTGSVSEQYTHYATLQINSRRISLPDQDYLNQSVSHVVVGYNFSGRFGLSANLPIVYNQFKRFDFQPPFNVREQGSTSGIGDVAFVARWSPLRKVEMEYTAVLNLLAGVKFPTGNADRVRAEVATSRLFDTFFPPGHSTHDSLAFSGVHDHMLAPGSGSYDGIFGVTLNTRRGRVTFNAQAQYYLRTPGAAGFEFGDETMVSGGPGYYLLLRDNCTLNLAFNGYYESQAMARIDGRESTHTGMKVWYVGPLLTFTLGEHLSANAAVDVPLSVSNSGLQVTPNYRVHGGFNWRF
ncbi:MAG: hypothetical protein HY301_16395 [Verrucomicrobia bacterium]|nr:hypothetical protein [Verrucomicrobiota bacterium]